MTRDEFNDWLEENGSPALDNGPQSDTTATIWVKRLFETLKPVAKDEDMQDEEVGGLVEDDFEEEDEDDEDEEDEEEEEGE